MCLDFFPEIDKRLARERKRKGSDLLPNWVSRDSEVSNREIPHSALVKDKHGLSPAWPHTSVGDGQAVDETAMCRSSTCESFRQERGEK